jgi:hypothetical protein
VNVNFSFDEMANNVPPSPLCKVQQAMLHHFTDLSIGKLFLGTKGLKETKGLEGMVIYEPFYMSNAEILIRNTIANTCTRSTKVLGSGKSTTV